MNTLDDFYSDSDLSFGKILVLDNDSKLPVRKIKLLTSASTVQKIKFDRKDAFSLFGDSISHGLSIVEGRNLNISSFNCYQLTGDINSSALRIYTDSVLATLNITADDFKRFHNFSLIYCCICDIRKSFDLSMIDSLRFESPTSLDEKKEFYDFKSSASKLQEAFGRELYQKSLAEINSFFKSKW